jgi:tetratricopeptide (TPR) repeat protein
MQAAKLAGPATLSASGALLFVALFFGDGTSGGRLFWIGSFAVIGVAVLVAAGPVKAASRAGRATLVFLAALAAWVGLTMWWSIAPDRSWDAFDRILVYGAFALLGLLATRVARPARTVAGGLAALVGLVLLWALAGKVVPSLFPDGARVARLRNPVGYWNALALVAATAVPLGLWLAASRGHHRAVRAVGALLVYLAELVVVLTYSRGGVAVAVLAALAWLALSRDRLESLGALAVATPAAGLVALWAFSRPAITDDLQPYASRVSDGAWFGVFVSVGAAVVLAGAYLAGRVELPEERRRAYTRRLGAVIAVAAVAAFAVVVIAKGGAILDEFRGAHGQVSQDPTRLAELSSSNRWTWWQEAWTLFEDAPAGGKGAATFELARRGARVGSITTTEPHNLPLQFLSETGVVGFLLLLAVAAAGVAAARSALRRLEPGGRAAAAALAIGVGAYALHALIDIDWEFVAVGAPAFLVLGVLAGLGSEPQARRRRPVVAAAVAVAALGALYSLTAPFASGRLVDSAYNAIAAGKTEQALSDGRAAHGLNPLAVDPLLALADAEAARPDDPAALRRYRQAVALQPENSSTWYALGSFELFTGRYRAALHDLDRAYGLDPYGPAGRPGGLLDQARAKLESR